MGASYYWYKDNGICVRCGQRRAIEGKTLCSVCQEKIHKWYKDNRSKRLCRTWNRGGVNADESN